MLKTDSLIRHEGPRSDHQIPQLKKKQHKLIFNQKRSCAETIKRLQIGDSNVCFGWNLTFLQRHIVTPSSALVSTSQHLQYLFRFINNNNTIKNIRLSICQYHFPAFGRSIEELDLQVAFSSCLLTLHIYCAIHIPQ